MGNVHVDPAHSTPSPLSDSEDKDKIDNCVDDSGAPAAIEAAGVVNDNEEESGFEDNNDEADDDSSSVEEDGGSDLEEDPMEVKSAWDELQIIQREQQRYSDIKLDLAQDLEELKGRSKHLEDELPKRISTEEEAEVLSLLCKVHELEIGKVEMQSEALLKEHEVRRRDLLILKYNKQRSLCDEIIQRQKALIEGSALPMPPELMDLYSLYQKELNSSQTNEKETQLISDLNTMMRTPSMISLRGPEPEDDDDDPRTNRLPPIKQEESDRLFQSPRGNSQVTDREINIEVDTLEDPAASNERRMSLTGPTRSSVVQATKLPPIPNSTKPLIRSQSFGHDRFKQMQSRIPKLLLTDRSNNSFGGSEPSSADSSRILSKSASVVKPRNYSAPGIRNPGGMKKAAAAQNRALPSLGETKKKPLRKKSEHTDPFQNFGMPLERF